MKKPYLLWPLALLLSPALNAQTCQTASIPATTPTSRFTVNANGTVADKQTGLSVGMAAWVVQDCPSLKDAQSSVPPDRQGCYNRNHLN